MDDEEATAFVELIAERDKYRVQALMQAEVIHHLIKANKATIEADQMMREADRHLNEALAALVPFDPDVVP